MSTLLIALHYGKGQRKDNLQRNYEFFESAIKRLKDYAFKINTCGNSRNSYSKTDKDATFMRIKTDYMGNDQLLPSYNVQFGISDEYISILDVNQFASDQDCFIPLMEKFNNTYHFYPKYPVADAGYGSLKNYDYCEKVGMEKYMKYPIYEKETKDKKYQNNPFKPINFKINEKGNPVCPRGKEFIKVGQRRIANLDKDRYEEKYACTNCFRCHFKSKCTKAKGNRTIILNRTLTQYHEEVKHNLLSIHGALLLMNRTILSEGSFGILKYDRGYKRITRRGLVSVNMELTLIAMGFNIRKLHTKNA